MGKIATRQDCNSILPGVFTSNLNGCPTYQEIIATGQLEIKGSYSQSQLVQLRDISEPIKYFYVSGSNSEYGYAVSSYGYITPIPGTKLIEGGRTWKFSEDTTFNDGSSLVFGEPLYIVRSDNGLRYTIPGSSVSPGTTYNINI